MAPFPCRILEIIASAGFARFFAELVELGGVAQTQSSSATSANATRSK
jgi:hypothetical protein